MSLTPRVNTTVHLFLAPCIWTVIGVMLMFRGFLWIGSGNARWLVLAALLLGTLKSRYVLDKTAQKTLNRIKDFSGSKCCGAVYSWKTWLLVMVMMGSGIAMRTFTRPGMIIGTLYMAIGWALFLSSRHGWKQWLHQIRHD